MRKISCEKGYHHEEVVMEVVEESYLVFPWANEGPLCTLGMHRCKKFWLRLTPHTLEDCHMSGGLCEENNLLELWRCTRMECLSLVKHPEEHKRRYKGIILVLGGLSWY